MRLRRGVNRAFTGTAGVSPASSSGPIQIAVESVNSDIVAFSESGRDARGPSKQMLVLATLSDPPCGVKSSIIFSRASYSAPVLVSSQQLAWEHHQSDFVRA
jgi:hypothetical protein